MSKKQTIGNCTLYHGDCFDILPKLTGVLADAVISDPPFGITACDWDIVPPLSRFWDLVECRSNPAANFVLFGCGKFTIDLINSKYRWYRYDLVWYKNNKVGFFNANLMPMRNHEQVLVLGRPGFHKKAAYNPQKTPGGRKDSRVRKRSDHKSSVYSNKGGYTSTSDGMLHPCSVLPFKSAKSNQPGLHPTQKPLALMEWLVKTYTNENDTVIDPFMGSGTTGIACAIHNRRFIGIEKEREYFNTAAKRIREAYQNG